MPDYNYSICNELIIVLFSFYAFGSNIIIIYAFN